MGRAIIAAINPAAKSSVQVHVKQREVAISSGGLRWGRESQKMLLRKMLFKLCLEGGVESPSGGKARYRAMPAWRFGDEKLLHLLEVRGSGGGILWEGPAYQSRTQTLDPRVQILA